MKKLVINCSPDWEVETIKEVIKEFCKYYTIRGGLTLVNSGPNIIQGSTKKYHGTFTIRDNSSGGKDLEIDYDEGSILRHGTHGKGLRRIFWENLYKGLKKLLEKPYSNYK